MKLNFEVIENVGNGNYPDLVHLPGNEINLLYVQTGKMRNKISDIKDGWDNANNLDDIQISQDENITHLRVETLGGFGVIGSYKTNDSHKLILAEYEYDI